MAGQRHLPRKSLIDTGIEWVKEKFRKETEKELDEQLADGMSRTATVLSLAAAEHDAEKAEPYAKAAEQFTRGRRIWREDRQGQGARELVIEFNKALREAKDGDLSRDGPDGAAKRTVGTLQRGSSVRGAWRLSAGQRFLPES